MQGYGQNWGKTRWKENSSRRRRIYLPLKNLQGLWEKKPWLKLDCDKSNYTQIYTEKNGPNYRLIKKEKNQTNCSKYFKGGTRRKPVGFAINPRSE